MRDMQKSIVLFAVIVLCVSGCASKNYVNDQLELVNIRNQQQDNEITRIKSDVETDVTTLKSNFEQNEQALTGIKTEIELTEKTLAEKLESVKAKIDQSEQKYLNGRKLLYQVTISDDSVRFAFDRRELSEEAREALDVFAAILIAENKDVYLEIQGHTDNIGSESYNYDLGYARAEAVKRYLHMKHGIPLHRTSVISYGETQPIADNTFRKGRAQNRRVVLMVME